MNPRKAIQGIFLSLIFLSVIFFTLQKIWEAGRDNNFFFAGISESVRESDSKALVLEENYNPFLPQRNWNIPELVLQAQSGIAIESSPDETDKVLFNKNSYLALPIASLTKLMTAVISLENYNLSKKIKISEEAISQVGKQGAFEPDMEMTANDLLYITLIESSNQAAYALSEGMDFNDFVRLMNEKAKELDMRDTFFAEPTGLSPKNVSTARDLAKLGKYILISRPEISNISRYKEYDLPNYGKLTNTDELLGEVPEIVASKTGFTIEAKGTLLLLINNSKKDSHLIFVVLGADDRFAEMKKMIEWVNQAYVW